MGSFDTLVRIPFAGHKKITLYYSCVLDMGWENEEMQLETVFAKREGYRTNKQVFARKGEATEPTNRVEYRYDIYIVTAKHNLETNFGYVLQCA